MTFQKFSKGKQGLQKAKSYARRMKNSFPTEHWRVILLMNGVPSVKSGDANEVRLRAGETDVMHLKPCYNE